MDCAQALRHGPNVKAFYRSAVALLALDKIDEAEDACQRGLVLEGNRALTELASRISARREVLAAAERQRRARVEQTQALAAALQTRNIRVRQTRQAPDLEDARIHLEASTLHFPVILLYPMHAQSDLIKSFAENDTFPQHLAYILPLPWDEQQEYRVESVELYMETTTGMIKIGKKMQLGQVLGRGEVEVVDDLVRVNVVPKAKASAWIGEMKQRRRLSAGGTR